MESVRKRAKEVEIESWTKTRQGVSLKRKLIQPQKV